MTSHLDRLSPHYWRQLGLITSNISEGVIIIDINQSIIWANSAALAMHGVDSCEALGPTIDEYRANFQIKFRGSPTASMDGRIDSGRIDSGRIESVTSGETFRDVVVEVTPLHGSEPKWVHRVRNLVLNDEAGNPMCIVLVMHALGSVSDNCGRFASTLEDLPTPAAILRSADQSVVAANEAFLRMTGLDRPGLAARPSVALDVLETADDPERIRERLAQGAPLPLFRCRLAGADGTVKQVFVTGQPVEYGHQRWMLLNFIDPAACFGVEATHSAPEPGSLAHTVALCRSAPQPVHVLDEEMRVQGVNLPWLDWLGYDSSQVVGRRIVDFMTSSSAAHFRDHTWKMLGRGGLVSNIPCQFVKKSGEIIETMVSAHATTNDAGDPLSVVGAPMDITERKSSEERFAKLFESVSTPVLVRRMDDFRILDANQAFFAATGFSSEAVIGHSVDEFGLFETRVQRQHFEHQLREAGPVRNIDAHLKTQFGEVLDCLLSAEAIEMFGQPCALLIFQDITDRRRNETQLFQAIEAVMADTTWFSRTVIEKLASLRAPPRPGGRSAEIGDLTPREREVLGLISHGMTDTDIAEKLGLTRSTVRNHVATLYSKIGVHSRSSAIVWARERGINIAWGPNGVASLHRHNAAHRHNNVTPLSAKIRRT